MTWYAAHIVILYRYRSGKQSDYPMREHIVLIEAADPTDGYSVAEAIGESYATSDVTTEWNGRAVQPTFAEVRRLVECADISFLLFLPVVSDAETRAPPGQAAEPTYSFFRADSEFAFEWFRDGRTAELWYEAQGADEPD